MTNLMGPVTAILLLPTLGWKTVTAGGSPQAFSRLASADAPFSSSESFLNHCSDAQLTGGQFSCGPSGTILDLLFHNDALNDVDPVELISGDISYTFNETYAGLVIYSPTKQVMDELSNDYDECNTTSVINAGNGKVIRCYDIPAMDIAWGLFWAPPPNSSDLFATRCIREGPGWPFGSNNQSGFSVETGNSSSPTMNINVYSSDRAVFLNTSTLACTNASTPNCDWDALFADNPDPLLRNISVNAQVTEYMINGYITAYYFTSTYLRFPTYSLNTSPISNPQFLVAILDPDLSTTETEAADPIIVNPDWTLVAWSVDNNGTVTFQDTAASHLLSAYQDLVSNGNDSASLSRLQNLISAQGQFYIPYSTTNKRPSSKEAATTNPILDVKISVYVWSYGIKSKTAKLGVVVAIFGCVLVLLKFIVGLTIPSNQRSFLNLFVGALAQTPPQALHDMTTKSEQDVAKWRFHIEDGKWPEFQFGSD